MPLDLIPVPKESSNVKEVGYDPATRTLGIRFANGKLYHYEDVPDDVYTDLLEADSIGGFIAKNVRGQFKTTPIDEDEKQEK